MAKKKHFDWTTHSKPVRLLSPAQEAAFASGALRSVLDAALGDARYRFEIRARSANLYRDGISLLRLTGEGPFTAETDLASGSTREELTTAEQVSALLERVTSAETTVDVPRRAVLHALASANAGADLYKDEIVIIDSEYNLGQRKLDLVALRRSEGVTGPGGFANPELVFVDVRCCGQTLNGNAGMASVAADLAEFAKALGGEHLARAKAELTDLTTQKVRLGLLPEGLELRGFTDSLPELLVIFSAYDIRGKAHDRPLIDLAERLAARHYPAGKLLFAHYERTPEPGDGTQALREGRIVGYREFKAYRHT